MEISNIEKEIFCSIVEHDELAYICEKIILEQLKITLEQDLCGLVTHKGVGALLQIN